MEHEVIPAGEIHAPHNWVVADEAARLALVVTEADLGKYCWQRAGETEWFLIGHTPAVWKQHVGPTGADGAPGADGASAYEVAVVNGFVGTEVEWLAFLQGSDGVDGSDGREVEVHKSATHIQWRYVGDAVWADLVALNDITGPAGADGDAADTAAVIHAATSKTTPVDADELGISDSAGSWGLKKLTWANLKATLAAWIGGGTVAGSFTTLAASNTIASSKDGGLVLSVGGTTTNCYARFLNTGGSLYAGIESSVGFTVLGGVGAYASVLGTGGATPLYLATNNSARLKIESSGDVLVTGGGLGYGVGSGGTVTQATSKSTTVTLNKPCGRITTHNEALAAGATVFFTVSNTLTGSSSPSVFGIFDGLTDYTKYHIWVGDIGASSFRIFIKNTSAGSLSDPLVLGFAITKVATS